MNHPRLRCAFACAAVLLVVSQVSLAQGPVAGRNVNMVSGTDWTNGDPFLQRQNEPTIAVSTRNTLHLLAGANDYRTVDLPGLLGIQENGDSWLGVFKSADGGQTWGSTLLPGYPLDTSPEGLSSPIHGFQAASDPVVRAGSSGLFYYAGIAFNRGTNALGGVFVTRYIDNNNRENGDPSKNGGNVTNLTPGDAVRYVGTTMVGLGTAASFIDKPWLSVDVPRAGRTCPITTTNPDGTTVTQTIPAGRVFLAYASFDSNNTSESGSTSRIKVRYSDDCGGTWSKERQVSQVSTINQGAVLAIDPSSATKPAATLYLAWRRFAANGLFDAVKITKSVDGGVTWSSAVVAIKFPLSCTTSPTAATCPFDQGGSSAEFRTNSYPTMTVDDTGRVYIAVSQRQANGDARVVMAVSADGVKWPTAPSPIDNGQVLADDGTPFSNLSGRGHQAMPALTFAAGRLTLAYYDLREDHTIGTFTPKPDASGYTETRIFEDELTSDPASPSVFNNFVSDAAPPLLSRRHTIDVAGAQASIQGPGILTVPMFNSFRISRYPVGVNPYETDARAQQLSVNAPNLPMFVNGTTPFMGDYIDIAGAPAFIFQNGTWQFNSSPSNPQFFFASWTDNRDVTPPPDGDWTKYVPVYSSSNPSGSTNMSKFDPTQTVPPCVEGQNDQYVGSRNQNIYSSRIDPGLVLSSPGNQKTLGFIPNSDPQQLLSRAFPLFLRNNTNLERTFRLTITNQPALANGNPDPQGQASFQQTGGIITTLDVTVPSFSNIARSVFAISANPTASVGVSAAEITGPGGTPTGSNLNGSITMNPDPNAPQIIDPDNLQPQSPSITVAESYDPQLLSPEILSPFEAPGVVLNPSIKNPSIKNPSIKNPSIKNQSYNAALNPSIKNPSIKNSPLQDSSIANTDLANQQVNDAVYSITNTGNTTATYAVKLFGDRPTDGNVQLILAKQYVTPSQTGCQLEFQGEYVTFANIPNPVFTPASTVGDPNIFDPQTSNATIVLAPGETGQVIIRSDVPDIQSLVQNVSPVVVAHAANTLDGVPPVTLTILSKTLPDALTQTPYNASISFIGGKGALAWTLASGSLPPGLTLDPSTGAIAGTATATGDYPFTAQVTDSAATPNLAQQAFTIHAAQLLAFTTNTLPDAIIGMPYSANIPAGGGTGNLTFSLLSGAFPDGLSMDATGVISGTSLASNVAGSSFNVQVQVQDTGNPPQIVHATLTMRAFAVLSAGPGTTTLPDAVAGQPYSATLAASGGNGPFNWTIISGALPANLILNSATGGISGTPQAGGNSSFTATVQDQSNPPQTGNTTVNLNVVTPLVINIGGGSLPDGVVGTPYFATLTPLGGTGPFTFTLNGSLPAGLSLSAAGVISGTPTSPNFHATPSSFSVTAQDSGAPPQSATTQLLTIRIGAKLMVTTTSLPNASPGVAYNQTLTATGGLGNYTWSLNSGALPAGLTLSSGGVISGTPTSTGTSSFTVQVTDGTLPTSQVATQPLSIAVNTIYNIVFYVQPSNTKASYDIYPDVKVKVTDANGKAVKGVVCQMTIAVNPGGGVLTGMTVSTTNRNGIAVFDDLFINKQGTGYKLQVTITNPAGGGSAISVPFNIL